MIKNIRKRIQAMLDLQAKYKRRAYLKSMFSQTNNGEIAKHHEAKMLAISAEYEKYRFWWMKPLQ